METCRNTTKADGGDEVEMVSEQSRYRMLLSLSAPTTVAGLPHRMADQAGDTKLTKFLLFLSENGVSHARGQPPI